MSIRFRFTLLYTIILAITLAVFGIVLYTIQAQDTLSSIKQEIGLSATKLAEAALKPDSRPAPPASDSQPPPQPIPFDEFSSDQAFQAFPEREIARLLDENGNLVASPFGRQGDVLPLRSEGLQALQNQHDWWETGSVSGEQMLIYNRPVIVNGEVVYIVQVARPLTERNRTLQSLVTTLLMAGSLTVLVAFGIGWFLSEITLRPIQRITQTAQKIGDERDFTQRVAYKGPQDEVGQLADTFNAMLVRLQDAYQKVEHSLQMQRDFVADVSHELRTPLTTLRGNLGLLRRNPPAPPDEQADILSDMVDESDRLIRLVNDLLLLARADAGRSLAKEPLEIQPVLEETIRQTYQLDTNRQITLDIPSDIKILGDRDAFKQVMLILLDNALKHSEGNVNVKVDSKEKQVEIRVQDHGPGIPPDKMEHIFDRFYRGEESPVTPGFGLGLPIAKALVESMEGAITMDSEQGQGSVVALNFPIFESL